ncbi:MAG: hypothetical protein ACRDI2_26090, partial [Chloroflexota bacterium]
VREAGHDTSRREYVATVTTAASQSGDLARWRSVYPLEQLRTACRLAEHREDLRRLALRAQLHVSTRRTGDGP